MEILGNIINPFRGREVDINKPVYIYRNLRGKDSNKYSIRQEGLVIGHTNHLYLGDVEFKINEKARLKVIKDKRKNVHAFIKGYIFMYDTSYLGSDCNITYNPYKDKAFICRGFFNGKKFEFKVKWAMNCYIMEDGVKGVNCL